MSRSHFDPYVPSEKVIPEFTLKAVILGALFGIIFGATTVYLGLKVGLTVGASIPIAVLAISIIKKFGHSTILENNIVQTVGSAGESIAAGVVFTLPALLFLAEGAQYFEYMQIFILALCGGTLGVLFMVPLRRVLIVEEHKNLPYPEGTACADVLIAGESGGGLARKVYYGIGVAFLYKALMSVFGLWKDVADYTFSKKSALPQAYISVEVTPELLGVGYIVGPRIGSLMVAGGILASFVLTPLIYYVGSLVSTPILPATVPIGEMSIGQIWNSYIRYIGAGSVALGGIITMVRTLPTIVSSFKKTLVHFRNSKSKDPAHNLRTDRDLPLSFVVIGIVVLAILMAIIPTVPVNALSAVLIVIAGFFFVTVSSRIVGMIGTSSNPVSGMTISTLMGTSLIFISLGWTGEAYHPIALCVGAIVAIAAANAGCISQDLKTGFIIGATPVKQQIGMMIGGLVSVFAIGFTMILLHNTIGFGEATELHPHPLPAPQATLMATIIKGMLNQDLPWGLVLIGMAIAAVVELCGVNALGFAVGVYLPVATTTPIFIGGVIKWLIDRRQKVDSNHRELEPGTLFSSGLIAGGSIAGILIAIMLGTQWGTNADGKNIVLMDVFNTRIADGPWGSDLISIAAFTFLVVVLVLFAKKSR